MSRFIKLTRFHIEDGPDAEETECYFNVGSIAMFHAHTPDVSGAKTVTRIYYSSSTHSGLPFDDFTESVVTVRRLVEGAKCTPG